MTEDWMDEEPTPLETNTRVLDAGYRHGNLVLKRPITVRTAFFGGSVENGNGWFAQIVEPSRLELEFFGEGDTEEDAIGDLLTFVEFEVSEAKRTTNAHASLEQLLAVLNEVFEVRY